LVLLTLLAVLPALALQVYDAAVRQRHLIDDATQEARRSAGSLVQIQTRITDSTRLLLSTLAVMPQLRQLHIPVCDALFASLLKQNPIYLNMLAISKAGEILVSGLPYGRINLADRKHVKETLVTDAFAAGEYIVSRMADEPTFPFAYPLHDDAGALTGALLASINLTVYDALFDQLKLPEGSMLSIMDQRGVRLHYRPHQESNPIGQPLHPQSWQMIDQGGDTGVFLAPGSDGCKRYYAWAKARLTPQTPPYMVFVIGLPEAAVLDSARKALVQNILLLAGAAGLALAVAWFVGGAGIARRLDRIADTADRIGRGELSARTGLRHGGTGIGKVARTIDAMAELLAQNGTERERALAALRASQERLSHVTVSMADWIWEIDTEDRFTYASSRVRQTLGFAPAELYGKTPYAFMKPDEAERIRPLFEATKARREPIRDIRYWCLTKDGPVRCLLANGVPWHDETGVFQGYRGVSKDITETVRAERAVLESLHEKEILLKEIHHRVKNNLQIISGLLYLQEEHVQDPTALEAFRESRNRIGSMALVHEELYRSTNLSRVCLGDYVRDLLPRLFGNGDSLPRVARQLRLGEARVPIEQAVPSGLIINELLTNAYKHAFAGRESGVLTVTVGENNGRIEIEIRDDGPGPPADFSLEHTTSLGMQLVSNLARQLRGQIVVRNDAGAVFTLCFTRLS
jgi:PAS domain S-box-containing protein